MGFGHKYLACERPRKSPDTYRQIVPSSVELKEQTWSGRRKQGLETDAEGNRGADCDSTPCSRDRFQMSLDKNRPTQVGGATEQDTSDGQPEGRTEVKQETSGRRPWGMTEAQQETLVK